jgi:hypothetical protein
LELLSLLDLVKALETLLSHRALGHLDPMDDPLRSDQRFFVTQLGHVDLEHIR